MKKWSIFLVMVCLSMTVLAVEKDTVNVQGLYESGGTYGTLNTAIEAAVTAGTINNTVFKLKPYEVYVLSRSIYLDHGQNLELYAPKPLRAGEADAETVQNSAPPQIVWTEEGIDRTYVIQSYGDIKATNIWFRFCDILGAKVQTGITFENQNEANDPEEGHFNGCIMDYNGIGTEAGGTITVKCDHFEGTFENCYFRNNSDNHFRYYGRAISFPYQSSGWHYDKILFENCTFTNLSRLVMQEGNEYGDNIQINHCTALNLEEWVFQSAGWIRNAVITNSIFINPYMYGYRAYDVCEEGQTFKDWEDGECDGPGGGLINGISDVDSIAFEVPFEDEDRQIFIGNNCYMYQDWLVSWYRDCTWCKEQIRTRQQLMLFNPSPMLGEDEIAYMDSVNAEGQKAFPTINVDWNTIYDADPDFIVPATNQDTLKIFVEYKWSTNADIDWSYQPGAGFNQIWPLPENLAYNNAQYMTAAMGGFPIGDLNWNPELLSTWEAQRDDEWTTINNWLQYGNGEGTAVKSKPAVISNFSLCNCPNPFNPATTISFRLHQDDHVRLAVYDVTGRELEVLVNKNLTRGLHQATWSAENYASGTYIYKLTCGDDVKTRRMILIK